MRADAALTPILRRSVSDAVYEQLRDQILQGVRAPGEPLPSERALCEALGVNRGSVREALRRLEQARLVSVRHGGTSQVLDFREHAGLDLLGTLVLRADGHIDAAVVRAIMELRSAIAPDAARRAAQRRRAAQCAALEAAAAAMADAAADLAVLQERALQFWLILIEAADNLAYRLAFNGLRETYDRARALLAPVLADELGDAAAYAAIAAAVRAGQGAAAGALAAELVQRGEAAVGRALELIAGDGREETTR